MRQFAVELARSRASSRPSYRHTTHTGVPATTMRPVAASVPSRLVDVEFHDGVAALIGGVEPCACRVEADEARRGALGRLPGDGRQQARGRVDAEDGDAVEGPRFDT